MARRSKKPKIGASEQDGIDLEQVCDAAWGHFQSYLDNEEDSDELVELVDLVRPHISAIGGVNVLKDSTPSTQSRGSAIDSSYIKSRADLLPALFSVSSTLLAEIHISEYLTLQPISCRRTAEDDNDNRNTERLSELRDEIHKRVQDAMHFPNPGCWSMVANFWRMMNQQSGASSSSRRSSSLGRIAQWYLQAADHAQSLRDGAIQLLNNQNSGTHEERKDLDTDTLAWVECLLLNHMVGVELEGSDDSDNEEDDSTNQIDRKPHSNGAGEELDRWSHSMVEATSRFMAAMLLSTLQDHDGALEQLRHLDVTHRIHPSVWTGQVGGSVNTGNGSGDIDSKIRAYTTCSVNSKGFLPLDLYERLCQVFAPNAPYWDETDYSNRGYYSHFSDLETPHPNLIHQVVVEHLLPAAISQRSKDENQMEPIVGYEWWVHTRPVHASLGHNLHFDTDEAILNKSGQIFHPLCSSVLYLTGDPQTAGATIVLEQTPDAASNASKCWRNVPVPNSVLIFPGNLLHGVLPCPGECNITEGTSREKSTRLPEISELDWLSTLDSSVPKNVPHRLTLLVGFWTRRVPDFVETRLYGPCGPIPSPDEFKWGQQLRDGYGSKVSTSNPPAQAKCPGYDSVPCITPAWERVTRDPRDDDGTNNNDQDHNGEHSLLPIPTGMLDHRYFVKDAPRCFHDSLFDRDGDECSAADSEKEDE